MSNDPFSDSAIDPSRLQAALARMDRLYPGRLPSLFLTFEPELETSFRRHRAETVLTLQRLAVLIGALLYALYFWRDSVTDRYFMDPLIWGTLIAFAIPGNTALFVATCLAQPWRYTLAIARVGALFHTFGMLAVSAISASRGGEGWYEFLILQLMYDFFLLGLMWSEANLLALVTVALAPLIMLTLKQHPGDIFNYAFFIGAAALLGSIGCYVQERSQRRSWLTTQLLQQMSERDPLTHLFNHRAFYSRGDHLIRHARREGRHVAVLGLDIDHFKRFNDLHGHLAGDGCLREVARIVSEHARRSLDMAGRLGGEEFAVFLYDANRHSALARAEDLRAAVKALELPGRQRVSISIGVTVASPLDAATMETLMGQADVALYRAKHDHRDCVREWSESKSRPALHLVDTRTD